MKAASLAHAGCSLLASAVSKLEIRDPPYKTLGTGIFPVTLEEMEATPHTPTLLAARVTFFCGGRVITHMTTITFTTSRAPVR